MSTKAPDNLRGQRLAELPFICPGVLVKIAQRRGKGWTNVSGRRVITFTTEMEGGRKPLTGRSSRNILRQISLISLRLQGEELSAGRRTRVQPQRLFSQYYEAGTWQQESREQTNGWPDSLLGSCRRLETRKALSACPERWLKTACSWSSSCNLTPFTACRAAISVYICAVDEWMPHIVRMSHYFGTS